MSATNSKWVGRPAVQVSTEMIIHEKGSRTYVVNISYGETTLVSTHATCNRDEDSPNMQSVAETALEELLGFYTHARDQLIGAKVIP